MVELHPKSSTQWFYNQIEVLKPQLPTVNRKMRILSFLPKEYDTAKGGQIIDSVLCCRATDMFVLDALINLVEQFKTEKSS